MQPPPPPPVALRPPATPPGAAPPANWKSPLKELYNRWLHVDPVYDTMPIQGTSPLSPLQHTSRVVCQAITRCSPAGEEEVLLGEFSCQGFGRSRKDAEQDAAAAALQHISTVAPALGVVAPRRPGPPPSDDGTLRTMSSRVAANHPCSSVRPTSSLSPDSSTGGPSSAASTLGATGVRSESLYGTPRSSSTPAEAAADDGAGCDRQKAAGCGVDAAELSALLQAAQLREKRLLQALRSIRQAIDDVLADPVGS